MGFGKNYLTHKLKIGAAGRLLGKKSSIVKGLEFQHNLEVSHNISKGLQNTITGGNKKIIKTAEVKEKKLKATPVVKIESAEQYKKTIEERQASVKTEEEKRKASQTSVKTSKETNTLGDMIKAEEEAEAHGVNSLGFRVSKAKNVIGLINDLEKKIYPPVKVMVGLVRGYKEKKLERNEFTLLEKLNKDPVSRPALDKISSLL